jgi:hypothetical protein
MIVELVKPRLFLSKVPMVYGTIFSGSMVFGAIVFFLSMPSSSGPSPSRTAPPPPLSLPGGAPLLHSRMTSSASSLVNRLEVGALLLALVLHVDRGACCKAYSVRCLFQKKMSAVYHPYFPLFITPSNELVTIQRSLQACLVIITKHY